jgi:hypothetical protein
MGANESTYNVEGTEIYFKYKAGAADGKDGIMTVFKKLGFE